MAEPNVFIQNLAALAAEYPLCEKILVAPSLRAGRQWLDQVARINQSVTNIRITHPRRLLLDYAQPVLERKGMRPGRSEEKIRSIGLALAELSSQASDATGGYFTRLPPNISLVQNLLTAFEELEDAGVRSAASLTRKLVSREKADELIALLIRYRTQCSQTKIAGPAEIIQAALQSLRRSTAKVPLLFIPKSVWEDANRSEQQFFQAWPQDTIFEIAEDVDVPEAVAGCFCADSTSNEIRMIFRRIQQQQIPLDQVEIICLDGPAQVPAIGVVAKEYLGGELEELPLTINSGLPGYYSRPFRLLTAWLSWLEYDLPVLKLTGMIESGLIHTGWQRFASDISAAQFAARLKALPINSGPGDYRLALGKNSAIENMREAEGWLARWLPDILPLANGGACLDLSDARAVLTAAATLLQSQKHDTTLFDAYANTALQQTLAAWIPFSDWPGFDAVEWLRKLTSSMTVMGLGPQPGHLHVSDIFTGGHSGRAVTFVVGLDDSRFPGGAHQDPVLLDRERHSISRHLSSSLRSRERREKAIQRLLARLRGEVYLSYATYDVASGRELFSSSLYRRFARITHPQPAGVLRPDTAEGCLCRRDDWLWEILQKPRNTLTAADLAPWHPYLAAGEEADQARKSLAFTIWDGRVEQAGKDYLDEKWVLSPSQLEMLARCPMDFFFRNVLGVKAPDRYELMPGRWLRGNERGELLHDLFQNFMMRLDTAGDQVSEASYNRHRETLIYMLERAIKRYRKKSPPRDLLAFERDRRELYDASVIFLFKEIERSQRGRPISWEAALGGAATNVPPWQRIEPVSLYLPSGRTLRLQGRVDRIDRLHDNGGLVVWDYKTGRASDFSRVDPYRQGRHLQPFLYTEMLETTTREAGLPEPVKEFSYFFPMQRDEGNVITFEREELRGGMTIIESLTAMLAAGYFPFTTREDDVVYSDYLSIYEAVRELCAAARKKMAEAPELKAWNDLRGL